VEHDLRRRLRRGLTGAAIVALLALDAPGAVVLRAPTAAVAATSAGASAATPTASPSAVTKVLLRKGDRGALVHKVQFALKRKGYHVAVNGKFGPQTHAAVRRFQRRKRLPVTGTVDRNTWRALGLGTPPTTTTTTTSTTTTAPTTAPATTTTTAGTTYRHPKATVERWHSVAVEVGWPESKWKRLSCLIDRESHGYARAYNPSGAMGLLQIMYRAHRSRVGPDSSVLFDGRTNLKVGLVIYRASGWAPWGNACGS